MRNLYDQVQAVQEDADAEPLDADAPATPAELLELFEAEEAGEWTTADAAAFQGKRRKEPRGSGGEKPSQAAPGDTAAPGPAAPVQEEPA